MYERSEEYDFVYDTEYYVRKIISDDLSDFGVEPPDDKIALIRKNIDAFLHDCLRVGWYAFLNFYGHRDPWDLIRETCYPCVTRAWSYDLYLKKRSIWISLNVNYPYSRVDIQRLDRDENIRDCRVFQNIPFLPNHQVEKACHIIPDVQGIRASHSGCENYRMTLAYTFEELEENFLDIPNEVKQQIIQKKIPFLEDWARSILSKGEEKPLDDLNFIKSPE